MSATSLAQDAHGAASNDEKSVSLAATPTPQKAKPFVGLVPLGEEHAKLLAGREDEVRVLATNLRAARLTLLYGASGVGKSSILRAGVVASLRKLAEEELNNFGSPSFAVAIMNTWAGDSFVQLADSVNEGMKRSLDVETLPASPVSTDLVEMLRTTTNSHGLELLIILDQFEEFFLYHDKEDGPGSFAYEFPRAVNEPELRVRFLLSLRDDSLYKLDRLQQSLPMLFDNRLQVNALSTVNARQAIQQAITAYNETEPTSVQVAIEDGLIDEVLRQVGTERILNPEIIVKGETPTGSLPRASNILTEGFIDAPYMQLVMSRLWDEESARWEKEKQPTRSLRLETLTRLGGSQAVVQQHLDKVMQNFKKHERDIAYDCFYYLVTPSGTKYALTPAELEEYTNHPAQEIREFLEKLADYKFRIMRRVDKKVLKGTEPAYEAHHDRLALAMLAWRGRKEEQGALRWKRIRVAIISIISAIIVAVPVLLKFNSLSTRVSAEKLTVESQEKTLEERLQDTNALVAALQKAALENENATQKLDKVKSLVPAFTCSKNPTIKKQMEPINSLLEIDCDKINDNPKVPIEVQISPRVYFQIQTQDQRDVAARLKEWLEAQRYAGRKALVPGIQYVGPRDFRRSQLRYFHDNTDELGIAWLIASSLQSMCVNVSPQLIKGYEDLPNIRPRHYELWLTPDAFNNYGCLNNTSTPEQ